MSDMVHSSNDNAILLERAVVIGDLARLTAEQRLGYYRQVCDSLGLNPLTQPFAYLQLNGKLVLYAKRDAGDQLRRPHQVGITITARELVGEVYVVTARASMPNGRTDESIGAINIGGLKGDALSNAYMKAETKAKRRVTLSIIGLGWLDETEVDSIPDARRVQVNASGEITSAMEDDPDHELRLELLDLLSRLESTGHVLSAAEERIAENLDRYTHDRLVKAIGYYSTIVDQLEGKAA